MPAAILFDLDRTLVDVQSFTDYAAAWRDLQAAGLAATADMPPTNWDRPTLACMAALAALAGTPDWEDASTLVEAREAAAVAVSRRMPGVDAALEAAGDRPTVVVTLMGERAARAALAHHGIAVDHLLGRRPGLQPKPAPDQVRAACALVGVEPSAAVMIGDSTWDARAARSAGAAFIGVTNGSVDEFTPALDAVTVVTDLAEAAALLRADPRV